MNYVPRLTSDGMRNNPWWYSSGNALYRIGYGLPNCTCYCYGRYAEIRNGFANLPASNAGKWYASATSFQRGQTPKLGSIICYHDPRGRYAGHVAVVEAINIVNGITKITTSNSAYKGTYFWTETVSSDNGYLANWASNKGYVVQGFIYNDAVDDETIPTTGVEWNAKATGGYSFDSDEAKENATMMYRVLGNLGWTLQAICGLLGNVAVESSYNPWRWENDEVLSSTDQSIIETSTSHGYGLVQFTPAGKYISSSDAQLSQYYAPNFSDRPGNPNDGTSQLEFINSHADYISTHDYPISYSDYKTSVLSADYLAEVWFYNYERAASSSSLATRKQMALKWYDYLIKVDPYDGEKSKSNKMPLFMYMKWW